MRKIVALCSLSILLAACAAGPDYRQPVVALPAHFGAQPLQAQPVVVPEAWWHQLNDPELEQLIAAARSSNHDIRGALARLNEARALARLSQWSLLPGGEIMAGAERQQLSQHEAGTATVPKPFSTYSAGVSAAWELDLLGGNRRGIEAMRAETEARGADLDTVQVAVVAETVQSLFEFRGAQRQIQVAEQNLTSQKKTLALVEQRTALGAGSEFEVVRARAQVEATAARIPLLEADRQRALHRLATLTGQPAGTLRIVGPIKGKAITELHIGVPEELLRRRPEVRAAERRLASATAGIGVATAELFPRVSLSGFIGYVAGSGSELGESNALSWRAGPSISWTLLDLGRIRARIQSRKASADGALAFYEKTVLQALEDAENALTAYARQQARLASLVQQAQHLARANEMAQARYRVGSLDYLGVLDTERSLLGAEAELSKAETDLQVTLVQVYKALGAGWST